MQVCPHLASVSDPTLHARYASSNNRCYAAREVLPVRAPIQRIFCLSEGHTRCPLYLAVAAELAGDELPAVLEASVKNFMQTARQN